MEVLLILLLASGLNLITDGFNSISNSENRNGVVTQPFVLQGE
jgi:hypothetical protein